jgi:hypothetical protein
MQDFIEVEIGNALEEVPVNFSVGISLGRNFWIARLTYKTR